MSKLDDLTRLKHIRDAAMTAIDFIKDRSREDLDREQMLSLALVRLIEIMGEAFPLSLVDLDVVWQVVKDDLPELVRWVDRAIQDLESEE
jgi:uncharacterized protein with HEPN domain